MIIKSLLITLLVLFLGFVTWMNLTPGHFRTVSCGCVAEYVTDERAQIIKKESERFCARVGLCIMSDKKDLFLLFISNLDFNK